MLTRIFVAPDPGLLRLRSAARAVLGVGLAVTISDLAGHSLTAGIAGGLAALLALFTVGDATIRRQAATTALLPLVGFPVLALAAVLHDRPLVRDAAFLAVVGVGVYARRCGPRGHALGVFAFMTFFMAQFLHVAPGRLPELLAAVTLGLAASSAVRFGAWCFERHIPHVPVPAPLEARGLAHPVTRQAVQATVACALALGVGHLFSDQRWYWAVVTTWWIFVNTASRGETLIRGFRRVVGTVVGVTAGLLIAVPLHGAPVPTAFLVAGCVFVIFYAAAVSYTWMVLSVTLMAGLLYGLLGVLTPGLLALRLTETGVGALSAALAVALVLPITTHATTEAWIERALLCVHASAAAIASRVEGAPGADPAVPAADLDLLLGRVQIALAPLVHPVNPLRARKARAHHVLALLDECARAVRGVASLAADLDGPYDARLALACRRVERAVEALTAAEGARPSEHRVQGVQGIRGGHGIEAGTSTAASWPAATQVVLAHLHGLERALVELHAPLRRTEPAAAAV